MFDVPPTEKATREWSGELPIESLDWNVGLIVGPSGAGKSSVMRAAFGEPRVYEWPSKSVVDDFDPKYSMQQISEICQAVGFNTIPAWTRPYSVLSNGERFRVELARHLLEGDDPIVVDEFTSVVDRQVAQIGSHAVQKYVRRNNRKFVAVTYYDVADWLQPDWILEPATMAFTPRGRLQRPGVDVEIARVPHEAWRVFAPFHYLTNELHKGATCYGAFVRGELAAFAGVLFRPHPKVRDIYGVSRGVTLPDYQGLGVMMCLLDALGSAYKADGKRLHTYPSHPSFSRSFAKSPRWAMVQRGGTPKFQGRKSTLDNGGAGFGGRATPVFCYRGEAMDVATAQKFINSKP